MLRDICGERAGTIPADGGFLRGPGDVPGGVPGWNVPRGNAGGNKVQCPSRPRWKPQPDRGDSRLKIAKVLRCSYWWSPRNAHESPVCDLPPRPFDLTERGYENVHQDRKSTRLNSSH